MKPLAAPAEPSNPLERYGHLDSARYFLPAVVTDAMVEAYLKANDEYWREVDALPSDATKPWRQGTSKEATRVSLLTALAAHPAAPAQQAEPQGAAPVAWRDVVKAIRAVDTEAARRGSMFPQTSDEQDEDRSAVRRVVGMVEWYANHGGAVAEHLPDWPKQAAKEPRP